MAQKKPVAEQLAWDWELCLSAEGNFRQVYSLYRRKQEWIFSKVKNAHAFLENGKSSTALLLGEHSF